jgi:hypothetical protein
VVSFILLILYVVIAYIYCDLVHFFKTKVLAVPTNNAYQQIALNSELKSFKALIDNSPKYSQLLQQLPLRINYPQATQRRIQIRSKRQPYYFSSGLTTNSNQQQFSFNQEQLTQLEFNQFQQQQPQQFMYNQQQLSQLYLNKNLLKSVSTSGIKFMTVLAVSDAGLFNLYSILISNATALDQFLSSHIIVDSDASQNRIFYTSNDANLFTPGQSYTTLYSNTNLVAILNQMPNEALPSKNE